MTDRAGPQTSTGGRRLAGALLSLMLIVGFTANAAPAEAATEYYRDSFASGGFGGSDGTVAWSTPWLESEGDGADAGEIQVRSEGACLDGDCLVIGKDDAGAATVERQMDLSDALVADLSFDYSVHQHGPGAGNVKLLASKTGTGSWVTLATYSLAADIGNTPASFDLLPHASPTTRIRFELIGGPDDTHLNVDDVEVKWVESDNDPPDLKPVGDRSVDEGSLLAFTAIASDPNVGDKLAFSLGSSAPPGASMTPGGDFTWTPTESQGPGVYTFDVVVTDDGLPPMSDFETISVTVKEVNEPPMMGGLADQDVGEETLLTFSASATDPDLPSNTLTFSLPSGAPAGAAITDDGTFTWTPTEAQGPGTYTFEVMVVDDGSPSYGDFASVTITVNEVNRPPVLDPVGDQVVEQGNTLSFKASASDVDVPTNTLGYSLGGSVPPGASIHPTSGDFSWSVGASQTPAVYTFDVIVIDNGVPQKSDTETINVTVAKVNQAPVLTPIPSQTVNEESTLTFTAKAADQDVPPDSLTFTLTGSVPGGASIHATTGVFTWTPTESQGSGAYSLRVVVTDDAPLAKSDSQTVRVTVAEVNKAPELDPIADKTADEGTLLTFTASVSDPDLPANDLTFSLAGAVPSGAAISSAGEFWWKPTDGQGNASYTFDVVVADDGSPSLKDSTTVTIVVNDANNPPAIVPVGDQDSVEGDDVSLAFIVIDPEDDTVVVGVTGLPPGLSFDAATRRISGTVADGSADGSPYEVEITAVDDGSPAATAESSFEWSVRRLNHRPTGFDLDATTPEDTPVSIVLIGGDIDGDAVTYSLRHVPAHGTATVTASAVRYVPDADYNGPDTFTYVVSDGLEESIEHTVTVTVTPANDPPVAVDDAYEMDERGDLVVAAPGLLANDSDIDGDGLAVELATDPAHGRLSVGADGGFTFTPDPDFSGDDGFTYRIVDVAGETATGRVRIRVVPVPVSTATRTLVVQTVTADPPPPTTGTEAHVPVVERSVVLMSSAARASVSKMGFPLILLLAMIGLVGTMGRLTLWPAGFRGEKQEGTVRMYDGDVGFGLVIRDEDGADVFVHKSALRPRRLSPEPGDRVEFRTIRGEHRDMASWMGPLENPGRA